MLRIEQGIRCGDHFAVDPTVRTELAVISHAHSDHLKAHKTIVATAPTAALAGLNYKRLEARSLEYYQPVEIGPAQIELAPAGHMLGSAQVIMDIEGERIVYTGDFKLEENRTCDKAEIHPCDTLLIDTTFGLPHYRFPDAALCREMLLDFVFKKLKSGITPVILAYSFGKAQEALEIMAGGGIKVDLYKKAYEAAEIYRKFNIDLGDYYLLGEKPTPGHAVILPPGAFRHVDSRGWGKYRTCFLSGWVIDKSRGFNRGNGYGIPFSDHASFEDIIRYVETARPKRIFTLFGPPEIAGYLQRIGYKAEAVSLNSGKSLMKKISTNFDLFS